MARVTNKLSKVDLEHLYNNEVDLSKELLSKLADYKSRLEGLQIRFNNNVAELNELREKYAKQSELTRFIQNRNSSLEATLNDKTITSLLRRLLGRN